MVGPFGSLEQQRKPTSRRIRFSRRFRRWSADLGIPSLCSCSVRSIEQETPICEWLSQTQFPIHREMPYHYSSIRERKLLQKALKSRPTEIRGLPGRSSSPWEGPADLSLLSQFVTADSEIALFLSVLTSYSWMSLLPCPLRKKYFTITLCSIRSIQILITHLSADLKCRSRNVLTARPEEEIVSLNTYD
jgi:hypothetical protein